MDKFNRNYTLDIQKKDWTLLTINKPFTVEFDIHRNSLSSANVASFRIYNLNLNNRNLVRRDQFDFLDRREISFSAGYGHTLALAFKGNINQAWSIREGTDFITQVESYDGGFAYINAITSDQFPAGTAQKSIIDSLAKSLPGVTVGSIGTYDGNISRGNSYSGSTTDLLREVTGGGFFIDNGKVNCLSDDECIAGDIPIINAKTGLLSTPMLEQHYINFEMLFEPSLKIGQLIRLESETAASFNGIHKVILIKHKGTISDAICGNATTRVGLLAGDYFRPVESST